jgi:Putative adhesin
MKFRFAAAVLALSALPAFAAQTNFERTLSVSGRVDLSVFTGSGNVHLTRGSGNQIVIHGKVECHMHEDCENRVREIADHPPIEQTGSIVRIGERNDNLRNVSIDYEIQAPGDSFLEAHSGSGDITDDGVGENAKLGTGSGNIHANGLRGNFSVNTGSGDIVAEQSGSGEVTARTGSGNIDLKNLNGVLHAGTGSGDIKVAGTPSGEWKLTTGSGNIELWTGSTGFNLDAHTGSGEVHSEREMTVQGSFDHHHVSGRVNGGGPTVSIQTGSGDVKIH